jgi:hypothetical protein
MAKAPNDVKTICSFEGLCNFFRTHIKDFTLIATPLFKLTRKDSGYKGGPLPKPAMDAFINLRKQLVSEPLMAFPGTDQLITDAPAQLTHLEDSEQFSLKLTERGNSTSSHLHHDS